MFRRALKSRRGEYSVNMVTPREALDTLCRDPGKTTLAETCSAFGIDCLVAFGSTVDGEAEARNHDHDLDLAFSRHPDRPRRPLDVLDLIARLQEITGYSKIDLADLDRSTPIAKSEALLGGVPLFEAAPGIFAIKQMAAFSERLDTAWLRRLELDLLAG